VCGLRWTMGTILLAGWLAAGCEVTTPSGPLDSAPVRHREGMAAATFAAILSRIASGANTTAHPAANIDLTAGSLTAPQFDLMGNGVATEMAPFIARLQPGDKRVLLDWIRSQGGNVPRSRSRPTSPGGSRTRSPGCRWRPGTRVRVRGRDGYIDETGWTVASFTDKTDGRRAASSSCRRIRRPERLLVEPQSVVVSRLQGHPVARALRRFADGGDVRVRRWMSSACTPRARADRPFAPPVRPFADRPRRDLDALGADGPRDVALGGPAERPPGGQTQRLGLLPDRRRSGCTSSSSAARERWRALDRRVTNPATARCSPTCRRSSLTERARRHVLLARLQRGRRPHCGPTWSSTPRSTRRTEGTPRRREMALHLRERRPSSSPTTARSFAPRPGAVPDTRCRAAPSGDRVAEEEELRLQRPPLELDHLALRVVERRIGQVLARRSLEHRQHLLQRVRRSPSSRRASAAGARGPPTGTRRRPPDARARSRSV